MWVVKRLCWFPSYKIGRASISLKTKKTKSTRDFKHLTRYLCSSTSCIFIQLHVESTPPTVSQKLLRDIKRRQCLQSSSQYSSKHTKEIKLSAAALRQREVGLWKSSGATKLRRKSRRRRNQWFELVAKCQTTNLVWWSQKQKLSK